MGVQHVSKDQENKTLTKYKHDWSCWDCYRAACGDEVAIANGHGLRQQRISKKLKIELDEWKQMRESAFQKVTECITS